LFKKSGGRRSRSRWVPVEIEDVHKGGMYGEVTYSVWLLDSRRMVDYVRADELRFKHHYDLERRLREDEILRQRDETLEFSRNHWERGFSRGRRRDRYRGDTRRTAHAWQPRARSVDRNLHIPSKRIVRNERALSVPPENTNWPAFLAEFAKAIRVDRDYSGDDPQLNNIERERGIYTRDVQNRHDNHINENEEDHRVNDRTYRRGDHIDYYPEFKERVVERTPPPNENYYDDRYKTYTMDFKDPRDIHMNFVFPGSRGQMDRDP